MKRDHIFILILSSLIPITFGCGGETSPDENIVASFEGRVITRDQLLSYIDKVGPKCHRPKIEGCHLVASSCDEEQPCGMSHEAEHESCCGGEHGGAHEGCCGGTKSVLERKPCDEHERCCLQHYEIKSEDLKELVRSMVIEQMVRKRAEESVKGEENVEELIKYITEGIYLQKTHLDMERRIKPTEEEIRRYYDERRESFGGRKLEEVRNDIIKILRREKHRQLMPEYIEELKRNAFIKVNYDLLKVEEPTEDEMRLYYRMHRKEFTLPEEVEVKLIRTQSEGKAKEALAKIRSGERFEKVAKDFSIDGEGTHRIRRGERSGNFEDNVFRLREGEISDPFRDGSSYYIVKLERKRPRRLKGFDEVAPRIKERLMREKEREFLERNRDKTLFFLNDQRYTIGDFYRDYEGLPTDVQASFSSFEGRKRLVDKIIEYKLLVQDAYQQSFDKKTKEIVEEITGSTVERLFYLREAEKIKLEDIKEEEAKGFYRENKDRFVKPAKARIKYIRISAGENEKIAKHRIKEAYNKIKRGITFETVAGRYSEDPWSSSENLFIYEGGDELEEQIMHQFHEKIFSLKEGEVSKPFKFEDSYYIVKLLQREEKEQIPFEEVKEQIKGLLLVKKRRKRIERLREELLRKADLVIYDNSIEALSRSLDEMKLGGGEG
jgi:parvulin-like peptidyl-prolyl isomerase